MGDRQKTHNTEPLISVRVIDSDHSTNTSFQVPTLFTHEKCCESGKIGKWGWGRQFRGTFKALMR